MESGSIEFVGRNSGVAHYSLMLVVAGLVLLLVLVLLLLTLAGLLYSHTSRQARYRPDTLAPLQNPASPDTAQVALTVGAAGRDPAHQALLQYPDVRCDGNNLGVLGQLLTIYFSTHQLSSADWYTY